MENRNIIFGGAIVVAVIVAALTSSGGDSGVKVRYSEDNDNHRGWSSNSHLNFKGKDIECGKGDTVTLTHEDGSETVVTCE